MGYNLQYDFQFTNELGQAVEVQILGNGFAGASKTVQYGGTKPVVINYPNNTDRLRGVRGSECLVSFISAPGFTLYDLYTQDERQYLLKVFYNSVLYWQGFISPDFSSEPFDEDGTYEITMKATCGLSNLSGFNFLVASGNTVLGNITLTVLLRNLFYMTGLSGNFHIGLNILEIGMNSSLPMSDQLYINVQRFYDTNGNPLYLNSILEDICQVFGAIVFQRGGEFWIVRQNDFPNFTYYTAPISPGPTTGPNTANFYNQWVNSSNSLWNSPYTVPIMINNDQYSIYDLSNSEVKYTQDLSLLATGTSDPTFSNWTNGTTGQPIYWISTFYSQPFGSPYSASYPYNNPPYKATIPGGGITFKGSTTLGNPYYIQSLGINASTGDTLEILFQYYFNSDFFQVYWKVYFIDVYGNQYWLNYNPSGVTSWSSAGASEPVLPFSSSGFNAFYNGGNEQQTFTLPGCPDLGRIFLRLYGTDSRSSVNGVTLTKVLIYKTNKARQSQTALLYDVTQSGKLFTDIIEKSVSLGDCPNSLYAGAFTRPGGVVTSAWNDRNYSGTLILITAYNTFNRYKKQYRVFSGSCKALTNYGDSYTIQGMQGTNMFLVNGSSIDLKSMEGTLLMTEYDNDLGTYSYIINAQY